MAGSNILQSYLIKLSASVDRTAFDGFMGSIASGISTVAKFGAATVGVFGIVQAGLMKLASSESALNDLSGRVGATTEEIERLGYVASQSGSSTRAMQSALEGLSSKAGQAAMGMAGAQKAFQSIGLNIRDSSGQIKGATALLDDLGRALSGRDRNFQLAALDRLGIDRTLLKSITGDISGLREEFDEMARTAGVDFAKTSKAASELTDEVGKTGTFIRMTTKVLGADLMGDTANWLRRLRGWIRENSKEIQETIGTTVKLIQGAGIFVGGTLKRIGEGIAFLHKKTDGLSTAFLALAGVVAVLGWPVTLIAAGIAAIVLVVDDLMTALEGGKTLIDWSAWLEDIRAAGRWLDELAGKIKGDLLAGLSSAKTWIGEFGAEIKKVVDDGAFGRMFDSIKKIAESPLLKAIGGIIREEIVAAFNLLKAVVEPVFSALEGVLKVIEGIVNLDLERTIEGFQQIGYAIGDVFKKAFLEILPELGFKLIDVLENAINRIMIKIGLISEDDPTVVAKMSNEEASIKGKADELYREKGGWFSDYTREQAETEARSWFNKTHLLPRLQATQVGPQMLSTSPVVPEAAMREYRKNQGREAANVEIKQENNITITGMQNAPEIGDAVGRAAAKAGRDIADKYRYSVGSQ